MDLKTVVIISTLLLMTVESQNTSLNSNVTIALANNSTTNDLKSTSGCSCPTAATITTSSSGPALVPGLITFKWRKCKGAVILSHPANSSILPKPVCHNSYFQRLLTNVCENKKGCEGIPQGWKGSYTPEGYDINKLGQLEIIGCERLTVHCEEADVQELHRYKVVTALLCCVLVVLLLMRYTRPTVNALQKRLSDRRQNRWVGPTQSHSVSYHRGKSTVNDGEKRLSYPALERLTVSDSREPSSNRNSGYNL